MKYSPPTRGAKDTKGSSKAVNRRAGTAQVEEGGLSGGLRDRIIAELDGAKIAENIRVQYLSSMTGRAYQTVRRWIAPEKPGLPDLESFALLCNRFNSDANWMLGLVRRRYPLPLALERSESKIDSKIGCTTDWAEQLQLQIQELCGGCEMKSMIGDDMEPRIRNGAPIWVDTTITEIQTNGIYLLEYQSRTLVRQAEIRIGEGLVLSCENPKYKPTLIKDGIVAKKVGLAVLGRIKLAVGVDRF